MRMQYHSQGKGSQHLCCISQGHEQVVGDLVFRPATCHELASVGDDSALLFWDTRAGTSPALRVAGAHGDQGIQCIDWSQQDPNFVATGAFTMTISVPVPLQAS